MPNRYQIFVILFFTTLFGMMTFRPMGIFAGVLLVINLGYVFVSSCYSYFFVSEEEIEQSEREDEQARIERCLKLCDEIEAIEIPEKDDLDS